MIELLQQVRDEVVSRMDDVDTDDDDYHTASTETDEDYRERMDSILDDVAGEVLVDYYTASRDRASQVIAEWFEANGRTNHATLVLDVLGINIMALLDEYEDERDMLILKACVVVEYRRKYPDEALW